MQIIINGKTAAVKGGSSIDYISENRLFGGGDEYTFAITLPLAGCQENIDIFGYIDRKDVMAKKIRFDCEIRAGTLARFGTATVTEITEEDVKVQFLAGRSEQNFDDTWDDVYINELTLQPFPSYTPETIAPAAAWNPALRDYTYVALPWWNNGSSMWHNHATINEETSEYAWHEDVKDLSWQPYLLWITKKICAAVGYSYDLSAWENNEALKYLLICNCLPGAWDLSDFARILPHWTVDEYFEKLELFLMGEFDIDHREKKIIFAFSSDVLAARSIVYIDKVVDEFTVQVKDKEKSNEYREARNLAFKSCDLPIYKYYECDKLLRGWKGRYQSYDTLTELLADNKWMRSYYAAPNDRNTNMMAILYAKDVDAHFVVRAVDRRKVSLQEGSVASWRYQYRCVLQPINLFGGRIVGPSDDADATEIEFIPAAIDFTEEQYGDTLYLNPSGFNESTDNSKDESGSEELEETFSKPWIQNRLEADRSEHDKSEYYSMVFLGWWKGGGLEDFGGRLPHPYVEDIQISKDWSTWRKLGFSIRINDTSSSRGSAVRKIDPKQKAIYSFMSDKLPDVRSIFQIQGRRYICEKITATIVDSGLSQLMKGEFFPLLD